MTHSFDKKVDKAFEGRPADEILAASPAALQGVSDADAAQLKQALGIDTVRDLAQNRFFRYATAILAGAGRPDFDPGPPLDWEAFFAEAPIDHYLSHPANRFRLEFGPVYYRGRLDGSARVLVMGQDPSTNEILAQRVFIGHSGQRVQGLLAKLGITRSYVMMNTFLFSVFQQFDTELRNISLEPEILEYRNVYLDRLVASNGIEAIIAIGSGARHAVEQWPGAQGRPVFGLYHPAAPQAQVTSSWNRALSEGLRAAVRPDDDGDPDPSPYGSAFVEQEIVRIPRFDLPFGLPEWHGRNGGHSHRDGNHRIIWQALDEGTPQ